jgi:serine/threonine protein kinase
VFCRSFAVDPPTPNLLNAEWKLLDFTTLARKGVVAFPGCTTAYAAPEVLGALEGGKAITVDPAQDIWALGVLIYEALSPGRLQCRAEVVYARATGQQVYPWEASDDQQPGTWRCSRLRPLAQRCLQRNPHHRLTVTEILEAFMTLGSENLLALRAE